VKLRWFFLSLFSFLLYASSAEAGQLLNWNFNPSANRLTFSTDEGVQPKAMLVPNPTRLVIDLPNTQFGRPRINQTVGNAIREVRVAQFDEYTTRIVVELAPGYTIDPNQVRVRGTTPTQWTVDIPNPEAIGTQTPNNSNPPPQNNNVTNPPPSSGEELSDLQVTQNGLFVRLVAPENGKINIRRSRDQRRIDVELEGATLPESLLTQGTLPLNRYGVEEITFSQTSRSPAMGLISLKVSPSSPDWMAQYSRVGGLVLFPKGGVGNLDQTNSNNLASPVSLTVASTNSSSNTRIATINAVELINNNQLLIRGDRPIRGNGQWNSSSGVYEIRINNAQLAPQVQGPQLDNNSAISRIRLRQENPQTVLILIQPALGTQIENLNQPTEQTLALQLRRASGNTISGTFAEISIPVPPPINPGTTPPINPNPNPNPNINLPPRNPSQGRVLVVIDPGHGGRDPGAIGIGGLQEKNVILPISQMVAQYLRQQGIEVMMTRDSDFFVTLEGRTAMANRANANLFVSIHANAISMSRPDVNGLETYYFQNGQRLAQTIHNSILRRINIRDRGVRTARFYVLRNARMPSVLVETGFVTGREDAPNLANPNFRQQMAEAIALGILEYIQQNRL
jgi:N-acetylmuramoyl-L-alanine amidase